MATEDMGVSADAAWLTAIYAEHELRLRRFVFGVLRDREATEDVVQATFAKAAEVGKDVHPGAIKSWLYRVALNEALDWRRRAGVDWTATQRLGDMRHGCRDEEPAEPLVRKETVEFVKSAIQGLSVPQQQVIRARAYEEKKFVDIAAEMNAPLATVMTHMRRALEKLRRRLDRME
jgi:RNA polymerase sigma-70 factor (ECF subfamily)